MNLGSLTPYNPKPNTVFVQIQSIKSAIAYPTSAWKPTLSFIVFKTPVNYYVNLAALPIEVQLNLEAIRV